MGDIQRPLTDDATFAGSGGGVYSMCGRVIVVTVIVIL